MKYKTRPEITIDAVQWTGNNYNEVVEFAEDGFNADEYSILADDNEDPVREGTWAEVFDYLQKTWVNVNLNDYIIKGTKGEFYPCEAGVFEQKYIPVDDDAVGGLLQGDLQK